MHYRNLKNLRGFKDSHGLKIEINYITKRDKFGQFCNHSLLGDIDLFQMFNRIHFKQMQNLSLFKRSARQNF